MPTDIALKLIYRVMPAPRDQAIRQAQRQGSAIGPLAGLEAKRSSTYDVRYGLERTRRLELQGRAKRVSRRQAEKRTPVFRSVGGKGHGIHATALFRKA